MSELKGPVQAHLSKELGIRVAVTEIIRHWHESFVIRIEGFQYGKPVVKYLKRFSDLSDTEPSIYRFAEGTSEFPAPGSTAFVIDEEVWLLLDRASGTLLADVCSEGVFRAYLNAAKGLAEFHGRAALFRWPNEFQNLLVTPESVESLAEVVLRKLEGKTGTGEFSRVDRSLLLDAERTVEKSWPGIARAFTGFPFTLVHGDCHYGNLFLLPGGGVSLIDWASAAVAPGLVDLVALVDVSLRMGVKPPPWADMLRAYLEGLPENQREAFGEPERAWRVCRCYRAFSELQWFISSGQDYGERARRELGVLNSLMAR